MAWQEYGESKIVHFEECEWDSPQEYWDDLDEQQEELNAICIDQCDTAFTDLDEDAQWEVLADLTATLSAVHAKSGRTSTLILPVKRRRLSFAANSMTILLCGSTSRACTSAGSIRKSSALYATEGWC
jgi:hypothetical protein